MLTPTPIHPLNRHNTAMKSDTPSSLTIILELDVDRYESLDVNLLFSTLALFCNR